MVAAPTGSSGSWPAEGARLTEATEAVTVESAVRPNSTFTVPYAEGGGER